MYNVTQTNENTMIFFLFIGTKENELRTTHGRKSHWTSGLENGIQGTDWLNVLYI